MRTLVKAALLAVLGSGLVACASGGDGGGAPTGAATGTQTGDDAAVAAAADPGNGYVPPAGGGEGCQFDKTQQGKIVGKQIKDFGLKDSNDKAYWLHEKNCGKKKIIWVLLATGW